MRIERLRLDAFGRLSALDSGAAALPGLVVVLGPNEAGKSTLFHFLTSMLYGFYPATRESNPYTPWSGEDPAGVLSIRLDAGGCVEVERRLRSQPSGQMTVGGRQDDLRNRTLPWAEHVPRSVFRQVYALTLADLAGLEDETWGRVQDRIVGAMGASDLRSARQVAAELEQEAGELWRPTRRGKQRIREVQDLLRALRERRRNAAARDASMRELAHEADRVRTRLQDAREMRQLARLAVDRVQALLPIRAQLRRIGALLDEAGATADLAGFPSDPAGELTRLRQRVADVERRRRELAEERTAPTADVDALGAPERRLLEHAEEIFAFIGRVAGLAGDRARLAALEQETRDLARRLDAAASPLLDLAGGELPSGTISDLPLAELRERVRRLRSAREELRVLEAAASAGRTTGPTTKAGGPNPAVAMVLLATGVALMAYGWRAGVPAALATGAAAAAVAVVLLADRGRRVRPGTGADPAAASRARAAALRGSEKEAFEAVAALLDPLPLHASVRQDPGEALVGGLERLQDLLRDRHERTETAGRLSAHLADADAAAAALSRRLEVGTGTDAAALAHRLEHDLRRAEGLREGATAARRELARIEREEARLAEEQLRAGASLAALEERLRGEGDGDPLRGAERVRARQQAATRARQLQDELEHAHPDLEGIRSRIRAAEAAGDSWTVDDDDLARQKARVEDLSEQIEALATRAEALERDALHLREKETIDAVDGEMAALQEEEQALIRDRDRRWLLAQLLRQADRRFREEHQPDLLRRAGAYLRTLTAGRYDRILADEANAAGRFQILGPGAPGPVVLAPPVSTGTLEQAYLSLRLAIVDHLDRGLERLPLFVDEILVNWDAARRGRGMDLLADVGDSRQVFAFTCHPEVARDLERRGARVLDVGAAG